MVEIPCVRTPREHAAARFEGSEKIPLDYDSSLGSNRSVIVMRPRFDHLASPTLEPPRAARVQSMGQLILWLFSLKRFFDKMEGLSRAMFSSMDELWCSVSC